MLSAEAAGNTWQRVSPLPGAGAIPDTPTSQSPASAPFFPLRCSLRYHVRKRLVRSASAVLLDRDKIRDLLAALISNPRVRGAVTDCGECSRHCCFDRAERKF